MKIHREAHAGKRAGNGRTLVKVDSLRMNALTNSLTTLDFLSAQDAR